MKKHGIVELWTGPLLVSKGVGGCVGKSLVRMSGFVKVKGWLEAGRLRADILGFFNSIQTERK